MKQQPPVMDWDEILSIIAKTPQLRMIFHEVMLEEKQKELEKGQNAKSKKLRK